MGSWASGNHHRERRQTTGELHCIHVRDITELSLLPGVWSYIPYFDVSNLRLSRKRNTLLFGVAERNNVIPVAQFDLVRSPRHLGGHQDYFKCECGKRVTNVYVSEDGIACRHCLGLLYDSQFTPKHEQPAAKAAKLRARLGGGPGLLQPLPERPKGMHGETYESLTYRILAYEIAAAQELKRYRDERWLPVLLKLDELAARQ